jgi:hypothetical protein
MTTDTEKTLRFHTYHLDHEPYPAAWGARAIFRPDAGEPAVGAGGGRVVDILPDRVDTFGSDEDKQVLFGHLLQHLDAELLDRKVARLGIRGNDDSAHVLLDDDVCKVVASPQASYGYLYITAVLKGAA